MGDSTSKNGSSPIGFVLCVSGVAKATGTSGSDRILKIGEPVFAYDRIDSQVNSSLMVELITGSTFYLGADKTAILDSDVFDRAGLPDPADAAVSVEAIQQALPATQRSDRILDATDNEGEITIGDSAQPTVKIDQEIIPEAGLGADSTDESGLPASEQEDEQLVEKEARSINANGSDRAIEADDDDEIDTETGTDGDTDTDADKLYSQESKLAGVLTQFRDATAHFSSVLRKTHEIALAV
ncbi:MAG: hypothetical protein OEU36_08180 [Gammaproteobacteria bacterium]|nr:hypothetical protein [Gammaproteobacteria bacterium]